jgi:DNA polymerase-1
MSDLTLIDLGTEFWRNWYGTRSPLDAYELTVERAQFFSENSTRCIVCVDRPPFRRTASYPEYKAGREERPEDAYDSLVAAEQQCAVFCEVMGVTGYEADDIIATLAELIGPGCSVVRKDGLLIDEDGCRKKFGVAPAQMHDWLTLVGDAADNVPGCPKVGPGRARDLLVAFGTLDNMLAAKDDTLLQVRGVGKGTVSALREWDPSLARELIRLDTTAPVTLARDDDESADWHDEDDPDGDEETDE